MGTIILGAIGLTLGAVGLIATVGGSILGLAVLIAPTPTTETVGKSVWGTWAIAVGMILAGPMGFFIGMCAISAVPWAIEAGPLFNLGFPVVIVALSAAALWLRHGGKNKGLNVRKLTTKRQT